LIGHSAKNLSKNRIGSLGETKPSGAPYFIGRKCLMKEQL
jgi:hypothetical protein